MLTVHMSGLMYFHGCHASQKFALVPNGMTPISRASHSHSIPTHYASFWIEEKDLDVNHHWWPNQKELRKLSIKHEDGSVEPANVWEFRLPMPDQEVLPAVTFPDEWDEPARMHCFEHTLPKLQRIHPGFEIDLDTPDAIARVPIRGGKLEVFEFNRVASVKWTIRHHLNPIRINVNQFWITLTSRDAEIVFSNNSDLLERDYKERHDCGPDDPNNHFFLYEKLQKNDDGHNLRVPCYPENLDPLFTQHSYLRKLASARTFLNDSGCTGTCC